MEDYEKILALTDSKTVELGTSFKNLLHKKLVLGQTRYLCRYGTLSDGHEKITPSQRYFQAIKEMYYIAGSIRSNRVMAMEAQADLLDAEEASRNAARLGDVKLSATLRTDAKILAAKSKLMGCLVQIEDQMRMLDEYNKVRLELEPEVERQYPDGIEQAEQDNWTAVFKYRAFKGPHERFDNIPLPPDDKTKLGFEYDRRDAVAAQLSQKNLDPRLLKGGINV